MIPVSRGKEGIFLSLFALQYLVGSLALASSWHFERLTGAEALRLVAPLIIFSTSNAIMIVEGFPMVAERWLKSREEEGERRGRKETHQQWEDWNRRRLEAERNNRPFNEPPPGDIN